MAEVTVDGEAVAEAEADEEGEAVVAAPAPRARGQDRQGWQAGAEEEEAADGEEENPADTGPDRKKLPALLRAAQGHDKFMKSLIKNGSDHKTTVRLRKQLADTMMRLSSRRA